MLTVIKFNEVSKCFDHQILYTDVNIKILDGEKVLLCGENGCGKTTLIRMITGEIQPDTGTIFLAKDVKISRLNNLKIWLSIILLVNILKQYLVILQL